MSAAAAGTPLDGDTFELTKPYRCRSDGFCPGTFDAIEGTLHVTFGTTARRGTFIAVWRS